MIFLGSFLVNLLGVLTAIVATIYAYFKWSYQYWKRKNVPYLEPVVPFGNFDNPFNKTRYIGDVVVELYNTAKAKGWRYCGIFNLAAPILMVLDLELVKNVLTKDFQYFTDQAVYWSEENDPISAHLAHLGGTKWRNLRTKLTPTFTSGKLRAMFQTLVDCGLVLEKYITENISDSEPVEIKDLMERFTMDNIGSCAFGLDCNSFKDPDSQFRLYSTKYLMRSRYRVLKEAFGVNFPNLGRALGLTTTPKDVSDFFFKLVKDTISYREQNDITRKDMLQLLINMKNGKLEQENEDGGDAKPLTMNQVTAQSVVFIIAGFETSSSVSTFVLFELATHLEIQDKVREEIKIVLAKHNKKMTYDSLSELTYMKQVIDEVMRKYPAISFLRRVCVKDYKVPDSDLLIEKGSMVFIPVRGIHYDEDYYKNSEVFDPERFSEENKNNRHHYTYIPFGEGPRICIGQRFGIMQVKVGLTSILRRYRVKLSKKTKIPLEMSAKTRNCTVVGGIWLTLEKI